MKTDDHPPAPSVSAKRNKPEAKLRAATVRFRVTGEEHQKIVGTAESQALSVSCFVRRAALQAAGISIKGIKPVPRRARDVDDAPSPTLETAQAA